MSGIYDSIFIKQLVAQIRATDQYGSWEKLCDDALLAKKYLKTKDDLKAIPIIADIDEMVIKDLRLIFSALAIAFEMKTTVMASVVLEMSHEGFGRGAVIAEGGIVIVDKYFKDAHRYGFPTLEKLAEEGDKMLGNAVLTYQKFQPCLQGEK